MGFVCVLCRGELTVEPGNEKLLTTPCGHLFHEKCFLSYMDRKQNSRCPACFKLFQTENSFFYIYPVANESNEDEYDFVDDEIIGDIIAVLREENRELKTKLSNLISMAEIIGMGYENAPQIDSIGANFVYSHLHSKSSDTTPSSLVINKPATYIMNNNVEPLTTQTEEYYSFSLPLSSCSSHSSQSDYDSLITNDKNGNGLNDYYRKLIKTNGMTEPLKVKEYQPSHLESLESKHRSFTMNRTSDINNKAYLSTRREFLTSRNRTTSWLKKMTSKSNKLLSETIVSDVKSIMQQIAEIKFFMNKLETQGGIVERLSQTAKCLVNYQQVTPLEKNLTERSAKELERDFCDVHLKTSDRFVTLEIALIRCSEIESFVEESSFLFEDIGNRLNALDKRTCETEHDVKMRHHTIISLLQMMESHKTSIKDAKISENDFRNCENSQILPATESTMQNVFSKYSSLMEKLVEMKSTVGNNLFCRIMKSRREPIFV